MLGSGDWRAPEAIAITISTPQPPPPGRPVPCSPATLWTDDFLVVALQSKCYSPSPVESGQHPMQQQRQHRGQGVKQHERASFWEAPTEGGRSRRRSRSWDPRSLNGLRTDQGVPQAPRQSEHPVILGTWSAFTAVVRPRPAVALDLQGQNGSCTCELADVEIMMMMM